jgi:hypothetical protein
MGTLQPHARMPALSVCVPLCALLSAVVEDGTGLTEHITSVELISEAQSSSALHIVNARKPV